MAYLSGNFKCTELWSFPNLDIMESRHSYYHLGFFASWGFVVVVLGFL